MPIKAEVPASLPTERFDGKRIELSHGRWVSKTILHDFLSVADRGNIVGPCVGAGIRQDIAEIAVAARRGTEQDL